MFFRSISRNSEKSRIWNFRMRVWEMSFIPFSEKVTCNTLGNEEFQNRVEEQFDNCAVKVWPFENTNVFLAEIFTSFVAIAFCPGVVSSWSLENKTFLTLLELITVNALENTPSVMNLIFKLHFSIYDMNQAISMQWKWNTHYLNPQPAPNINKQTTSQNDCDFLILIV